ncbi:MAG: hypothetical protein M3247_08335, partial [Thermoproteota archaeon]|nr:hypothetical protein [Thermoproteota archaeon]
LWTNTNALTNEISEKISKELGSRAPSSIKFGKRNETYDNRVYVAFEPFARDYWTDQQIFQETLASIMAYLNIGPAYGIALYCILQPLMKYRWGMESLLKMPAQDGLPYGLHPMGILHIVIAEQCMKKFSERSAGGNLSAWVDFFSKLADAHKEENKLTILS